jgi:hypothetical protein
VTKQARQMSDFAAGESRPSRHTLRALCPDRAAPSPIFKWSEDPKVTPEACVLLDTESRVENDATCRKKRIATMCARHCGEPLLASGSAGVSPAPSSAALLDTRGRVIDDPARVGILSDQREPKNPSSSLTCASILLDSESLVENHATYKKQTESDHSTRYSEKRLQASPIAGILPALSPRAISGITAMEAR